MSEDTSLDQFRTDESAAGGEASERETAATDDQPEATAPDDIEPAATTYAWDGASAACDECDEPVERRWQQDGGLVCVECKDWERA